MSELKLRPPDAKEVDISGGHRIEGRDGRRRQNSGHLRQNTTHALSRYRRSDLQVRQNTAQQSGLEPRTSSASALAQILAL
jgi:hypothetical protein